MQRLRGAHQLEQRVVGLTHAKAFRVLSAVLGSFAFSVCLMEGMHAYEHVCSVVELSGETCKLVLVWPCR